MTLPSRWLRLLPALAIGLASMAASASEITVSAAASLTNAFRDVGQAYELAYPGSKVHLNFGPSGALVQQIAKGAPVDVFASADEESMEVAVRRKRIAPQSARVFARNALVVVVPNAAKFVPKSLNELLRPEIDRVAVGLPASVPAGRYARRALDQARLWQPVALKAVFAQNVRQALDYVTRGEVDAGFVYATDAALMKDKLKLAFPVPLDVPITYPIAAVNSSTEKAEAARFIGYVLSPAGQAILSRHGFAQPPGKPYGQP